MSVPQSSMFACALSLHELAISLPLAIKDGVISASRGWQYLMLLRVSLGFVSVNSKTHLYVLFFVKCCHGSIDVSYSFGPMYVCNCCIIS